MDTMTRKEILRELSTLSERIFECERRLSDFTNIRVESVTPYTETKKAYIGDTQVVFTDTPQGNLTVFFPYAYTVERLSDRITVSFEALEEVADVTISIL